jgi:hypothetical protein
MCWNTSRCTASARRFGPYTAGAPTPAGAAAVVTAPQPQRRLCSRCSTTVGVMAAGMSWTWRRTTRPRSRPRDHRRTRRTRREGDRRSRSGCWSGTTPTHPRRAAYLGFVRCADAPPATGTPQARQARAAGRSRPSCDPTGASAPRPRPATARSCGPAPRSARTIPHATAAPTRTPHMITTPADPGHAATHRKIAGRDPNGYPLRHCPSAPEPA